MPNQTLDICTIPNTGYRHYTKHWIPTLYRTLDTDIVSNKTTDIGTIPNQTPDIDTLSNKTVGIGTIPNQTLDTDTIQKKNTGYRKCT